LSIGTAIYAIIGAAINAYPNRKLIGYSYREQLADVLPQIGLALISGASAWAIGYIDAPLLLILILQWIVGGTVYLLLAKILHLVSFNYALQTIKGYLHR